MVEMARDILGATNLPSIIDGDDGYGDVKSVARMISAYEEFGVGAVVLEDQIREVKQSGNNKCTRRCAFGPDDGKGPRGGRDTIQS